MFLSLACGKAVVPTGPTDAPVQTSALRAFLADKTYTTWESENAAHESAGPHGNSVRVWVSPKFEPSLRAGASTHAVGSAAVKELLAEDGTTVKGWAVSVKIADGTKGDAWYWYEDTNGSGPQYEGVGIAACVNCHAAGKDFFRSDSPVR